MESVDNFCGWEFVLGILLAGISSFSLIFRGGSAITFGKILSVFGDGKEFGASF